MLFEVLRFDKPDGDKEFLPLTLWRDAQGLRWRWKSVPAPRPLYNLDKLAERPDAPVVICEGEKSADAAARIFPKSVATTSPGGANAADKADWSVLRGRKVLIWPDDDAPGRAYAAKVGATLAALDCDVSIIDAAALARIAPGGGMREPIERGMGRGRRDNRMARHGGAAAGGRRLRQAVRRGRGCAGLHFVRQVHNG